MELETLCRSLWGRRRKTLDEQWHKLKQWYSYYFCVRYQIQDKMPHHLVSWLQDLLYWIYYRSNNPYSQLKTLGRPKRANETPRLFFGPGSPSISSATVHPRHPKRQLQLFVNYSTLQSSENSLWDYTHVPLTGSTQQASAQECQTFSSITDNRLAIWDTLPHPSTEAINLLKWGPHHSFR